MHLVSMHPPKTPRVNSRLTFFHSLISLGIANIASLLFSILKHLVSCWSSKTTWHDNIPGHDHSLVNLSLDLLSHTRTLDPQTKLDTLGDASLGTLDRGWQKLLDAILACELDELGLSTQRVDRVMPLAGIGVLVGGERIRRELLEASLGSAGGSNRGGWPASEEAL